MDRTTPPQGLRAQMLRTKPVDQIVTEAGHGTGGTGGARMRRSLGLWQLTALSIGASLGTGIFVVLGESVPLAGPAVVVSFVLAGVTALLSALSYAEMAGAVPVAGSSYSYVYATVGEFAGWLCGWCLLLEYGVSVAAVAVGWGQYVADVVHAVTGLLLPAWTVQPPGSGGVLNLPAALVVAGAALLLVRGAQESAAVNAAMVVVKLVVLALFCAVALTAFRAGNLTPFAPLGVAGATAAASRLFFSYIGFDAASTAGEEARDPRRDLPRAIVLSLVVITAIYCLVALAAVGAREWTWFDGVEVALVDILREVTGQTWVGVLFSLGALVSIASVVLTVLYGQTRILFSMARDGLAPAVFGRLDRRGVPVLNTVIVGGAVAVLAALVPLGALADATSIGSLAAFALVNVSVVVLRRARPDLPRTFRVPLFPFTPLLGAAMCVLLALNLGTGTWIAFGAWTLVGVAVYLAHGRHRSRLERPAGAGTERAR